MKKVSRIGSFGLALLLIGAAMPVQAQQSFSQKVGAFFSKNRAKIVAGVAAAAAIGLTVALGYHTDKTMKAIEKAGLKPGDKLFADAVKAVGLLGPLGMDRSIQLMNKAIERNLITTEDASDLVKTKIGQALANYWGVTHAEFILKAGFSRVKAAIGAGAGKAVDAMKNIFKS